MRAFKSKRFARWASSEGLTDSMLLVAVAEMERGLVDADLGGHVYKKRVALGGRGKSGGGRVVLVYRAGDVAFFVRGFAKKDQSNIGHGELAALKDLAKDLLSYSGQELNNAVKDGEFIEVRDNEQINS